MGEGTVTKVGRKYFTVDCRSPWINDRWRFWVTDWKVDGYADGLSLYPSEAEYLEELEAQKLRTEFNHKTSHLYGKRLSSGQMRRIIAILEEPAP